MQILAITKLKDGVSPADLGPHRANEVKHTLEGYLDGNIRNYWFQVNRPGAVFLMESKDEEEARSVIAELPMVVAGYMEVELIPLQPLHPLGTLIGREFSVNIK